MYSRFSKSLFRMFHNNNFVEEPKLLGHVKENYEEAINVLNKIASNRSTSNNLKSTYPHVDLIAEEKLNLVRKYLLRTGVTPNDLATLPVLHVSGTKGKGSTCAFSESILRHHGYKTGFFSSPHLIEVRERIRINGAPISKEMFSEYFWKVYKSLSKTKNEEDLPFYFQFIFIMAVHVFLQEKVDAAIIEVGIGGQYDPTNIMTNVPVAGITSLGYDHTSILGNTIESIAWNKAGIMKKGSKVFTVSQPENAFRVLYERSIERHCTLTVVQDDRRVDIIQRYTPSIQTNINLAIRMAEAWMLSRPNCHNNNSFGNRDLLEHAIKNCYWPGRYEIREEKNIRYYIDGAHTQESINLCINWYLNDVKNRPGKRCLLFNVTGGRSCEEFFELLSKGQFETVMFVPNVAKTSIERADTINLLPVGDQVSKCHEYRELWMKMTSAEKDVLVFPSVQEALDHLNCNEVHNLLVTGSLYLVGALSSLLNPNLNGIL